MLMKKGKNKSNYSDSVNKVFSYWRLRTMYSIIIGYAAYYLIREAFPFVIPSILSDLHYTKSQMGNILTTGAILYGVGKYFFGLVGDKYEARYVMAMGLLLSAFMSIFMGFSSAIPALTVCYALSMSFQSMGAPPCTKLLAHWFSPVELGTRWALWNTSQQIGAAALTLSAPIILLHFGWRYVFFIPGLAAILLAALLFNRLRDTPESLKLPSFEKMTGSASVAESSKWEKEEKVKLTIAEITEMVLCNRLVWYVGLANFFVYICRMTFFNWGATFLQESKGFSVKGTGYQLALYAFAGMAGGLFSGYISDKVFKGRRGPVAFFGMVALAFCIIGLWFAPANSPVLCSICMTCIGFLLTGPQILVGVAAADFASKRAAATANGFTGTLGYVGSAITGVGGGYLADKFGWNSVFLAIIISALCSALFFALTWNKRSKIMSDAHEQTKEKNGKS